MNWSQYYAIVAFMVLFMLGVHMVTINQMPNTVGRHKRSTSQQGGSVNSTASHNDSDLVGHETNSTPITVVGISNVADLHYNATNDVTEMHEDTSQTTTVSMLIAFNESTSRVPNVLDQNLTTEDTAQGYTADNKPPVINSSSSPTTEFTPYAVNDSTTHTETTGKGGNQTSDDSVFVVPQTDVPFIPPSTVLSSVTANTTIFVKDDGNDANGSLNLLAIVLPVAIFIFLIVILLACIYCCRQGIFSSCCPRGKLTKGKRKKDVENDLWADDGGVDNVGVISEQLQEEKSSEADSVVISATFYDGKLYEVDYSFEALEDSHLPLTPGSVVEVVEKLESGWWRGYVGENEGWFPATYVHTLDRQQTESPEYPGAVNQGFDVEEELEKLQSELQTPIKVEASVEDEKSDFESSPVSLQDKLILAISKEVNRKHQYTVLADYTAENSDELSISKGESLIHLNKDPGGWTRVKRISTLEAGWVPSTHIQELSDEDDVVVDNEPKDNIRDEESIDLDETVDWEAEFDEDQDELTGIEHRAIHRYTTQQEGDLSFEKGDTVIVFEMLANGWWRGCSTGQEGWFPATYVEAVAQTPRESEDTGRLELSLLPESKHVSIRMENNIEYPDSGDSSLERRMLADKKEKESDPLHSPAVKPEIPVRFVTPKLVRVNRGTLKRSAHKLKRPRRPAPAPPAGVEPYRTLTKHSLPRRKRKPPPPPKRTVTPQTQPSKPPMPPQRTVATKLVIPKSVSSSSITSPLSPGDDPEGKSVKTAPNRPAPPAAAAVLEARKQSIASVTSTGSFIPPPPMFMDTAQEGRKETKKRDAPPKPAKRVSSVPDKSPENGPEVFSLPATHSMNSTSTDSLDRYATISSKDSGSSWGYGSSLDKKDRPVMAVKPVMKFVQGDAWRQDMKRTSLGAPYNSNTQEDRPNPIGHESSSGPLSPNTMRVAPQPQADSSSQMKVRPDPAPRKSISNTNIPLNEIRKKSPTRGSQHSRPSTSSSDSSKLSPARPPPPRPAGPPPTPQHKGVEMRKKNDSNTVRRKSTLRRAAQSFHSSEKGHLNFTEDSFIKELGEAPGKPGWMLGMLADGTTGIYPKDRVEEITQGVRVSRV